MITPSNSLRLMQYNRQSQVRGSAAEPARYTADSFSFLKKPASAPAPARATTLSLPSTTIERELVAIRQALEGILRVLEAQPARDAESDQAYVTRLYREVLGRDPDADGLKSHLNGLKHGTSRDALRQIFLDSPEYADKQRKAAEPPALPTPAPTPSPAPIPEAPALPSLPPGALSALPSVPILPEYGKARIDRSSVNASLLSAATWVKDTYPQLFTQGDDRALAYRMMTTVIGVLRAHGVDAYRVVNHPSRPVGDPLRYGSDALVVNGNIYDVYGALGEANRPQVLEHGPLGPGQSKE